MTDAIPRIFGFRQGANTSVLSNTSTFPVWSVFDDAEVDQDVSRRRDGKSRVYAFTQPSDLFTFNGTTHYLSTLIDSRISPLGTRFTYEALWKATSLAADRYVIGGAAGAGIKVYQTTASAVKVEFTDSAASTTTLTFSSVAVNTVCALLLSRDGATLTGILNGVTSTATVSATNNTAAISTMLIGGNAAAASFVGTIDFVRILKTAETSQRHGWLRLPYPRAANVLFDMVCIADPMSSVYVIDRGPYEMHATIAGVAAYGGAALAKNAIPILALSEALDSTNQQRIYAVAGSALYPMRIA